MPAAAKARPAKTWAREYETVYIMRPTVSADAAAKIADRIKELIAKFDGKLTKVDNWGRRTLAYEIKRHHRGLFVYVRYVGLGELVAELERNLRLLDEVIRFQTVLVRRDVDLDAVNVDPEEVEFLPIEEQLEEEKHDRAKELGLVPREPLVRREHPAARAEAQTETEAKAETETETEAKTEAQTETEAEAKTETETETEAETETETETEAETEAEAETETETETEAETETETEAETETETEAKTEAETEAETEPKDE